MRVHTCLLLSNFQQNSCSSKPSQHSRLQRSCCAGFALQLLCTVCSFLLSQYRMMPILHLWLRLTHPLVRHPAQVNVHDVCVYSGIYKCIHYVVCASDCRHTDVILGEIATQYFESTVVRSTCTCTCTVYMYVQLLLCEVTYTDTRCVVVRRNEVNMQQKDTQVVLKVSFVLASTCTCIYGVILRIVRAGCHPVAIA